jgi:hypothetical protein
MAVDSEDRQAGKLGLKARGCVEDEDFLMIFEVEFFPDGGHE